MVYTTCYVPFSLHLFKSFMLSQYKSRLAARKTFTHIPLLYRPVYALFIPLYKWCYKTSSTANSVRDRESERENMLWGDENCETVTEARRTHHREDLKWSRQADNYVTCPEEEEDGHREMTRMHFNGIYIKAWQISSWVLDVRGCKKPFTGSNSKNRWTTLFNCVQRGGWS